MDVILGNLLLLVMCHLVGDYVLQNDFIAKTKGNNMYHLFVHCILYCLPFMFILEQSWQLQFLVVTHVVIDATKATFNKITYSQDQILHYLVLGLLLLTM